MSKYQALDFYHTKDLFTSEQLEVQASVRNMVETQVIPRLQKCHREESFPLELIAEFAQLGLLGANLKGYGCAGIDNIAYGLAMQELERGDSGIRSFVSVQSALVMYPIYAYGSEEQKQKYLPRMAQGKTIGCFGLTEPDFGSDPGGMLTTAKTLTNGNFLLNGNKMWITNGTIADVAVIWARLDGQRVRGFLVDKGTKGFSSSLMKGKFSLRCSLTAELHLQDCEVPASALLPNGMGLQAPLGCLAQARYGIAWGVIGAAQECYHQALSYTQERKVFKKPLASYQLVQAKLTKMVQEITKAQLLIHRLGQLKETGKITNAQISLAKMNNCKMALECAREARDMMGANGIIDEYPVIRHMMNLETVNTYEGTEDIHRLIVGREVTGLEAFGN